VTDYAKINLNFWITPDKYNLNTNSGGMKVYTHPAPSDWIPIDYNTNSGLWKHVKKCSKTPDILQQSTSDIELKTLTTMVVELIKSNTDLQKQMLEVCKNITK
jgi:hypothetical protein